MGFSIAIRKELDVGKCVGAIQVYANELGFKDSAASLLSFAVSELAGNIVKHGSSGEVVVQALPKGKGIKIEFNDLGKGIKDIDKAIEDGYTTVNGSLGIGLGVARRAVDDFKIWSQEEVGTRITIEKWFPVRDSRYNYSVFSKPDDLYQQNGDNYVFHQLMNGDIVFAVIDGLGEGYKANKIAMMAQDHILNNANSELKSIAEGISKKVKSRFKGKGMSIAMCKISGNRLSFLGIGDCECFIRRQRKNTQLKGNKGVLGLYERTRAVVSELEILPKDLIVLFTDGISSGIYTHDIKESDDLSELSSELFEHYRRPSGDATVMLVKQRVKDEKK